MTDTHSMLVRKKPDLNTYYELAKKAIEAQNIPQAQEHSNNGLYHARIENDQNWIERFNSLNYNLTQPEQNLTPSIVKEDLTKVKGIGISVAQQLRGIGINSIKSLVGASIEQIITIKGIGYKTAQKIQEEAKNLLSKKSLNDFTTSKELTETSTLPQEGSNTIDKPKNPSKKWFNDKYQRPKTNVWIKPSTNLGDPTSQISQIEEDFEEAEDNDTDISIINIVEKIEDNLIHNSTMRDQTEISTGIMQSPIITEFLETEDEVLQTPLPINKVKKPLSDIELQVSSEMMSDDEIDQKKLEILNILESYEYTTIDKIPLLQKVTAGIDILAIKCVSVSDNLVLLFISPIKLINYKKPLIASAQRLKIANKDEEGPLISEELSSSLKILDRVQKAIFTDLTSEGSLAVYLKTVIKIDLTIERSLLKKNLMFRTSNVQHKVIITPMLLSANTVGFEEKLVPFAYQKPTNTYILQISQLQEIFVYLEKKCSLIEKYCCKKSAAEQYFHSKNKSFDVIRKFSIPFVGFGVIFLFTILFQLTFLLNLVTNIGYACLGVYFLLVGYVLVQIFTQQIHLYQEFKKPYHRQEKSFDEISLILINEELSSELMNQFVYETLPAPSQYKIVNSLEQNNAKNSLKKKRSRNVIHNKNIFEKKEEIPFSSDSFSSFLEE